MNASAWNAGAGAWQRGAVLAELAGRVLAGMRPHPVRVAIDGCSAAGKTTLADELAAVLSERTTRCVIRVGIDHFKRAADLRTAYPPDSPDSYYLDSWDHTAVRNVLLIPLGPGGDRRYRTAMMDLAGRAKNLPTFALMLPFNNIQGTTLTLPHRRAPVTPGDPSRRTPRTL